MGKKIKRRMQGLVTFIPLLICFWASILILAGSIMIFSPWFYNTYYDLTDHPWGPIASDQNLNILLYLQGNVEYMFEVSEQTFSQREVEHMQDVRDIFDAVRGAYPTIVVITVLLLGLHASTKNKTKAIKHTIKSVSKVAIFSTFGLGVILAIAFKPLFIVFHEVVFTNDKWLLPSDSILITIYPADFFLLMTCAIVTLKLVIYGLLWWICTD